MAEDKNKDKNLDKNPQEIPSEDNKDLAIAARSVSEKGIF